MEKQKRSAWLEVLGIYFALFTLFGPLAALGIYGAEEPKWAAEKATFEYHEIVTENIEKIYWHKGGEYSVVVAGFDGQFITKKIHDRIDHYNFCSHTEHFDPDTKVAYIRSLSSNEKIRVVQKYQIGYVKGVQREWCWVGTDIHLHSLDQINGAGWKERCGKGCIREGMTTEVQ